MRRHLTIFILFGFMMAYEPDLVSRSNTAQVQFTATPFAPMPSPLPVITVENIHRIAELALPWNECVFITSIAFSPDSTIIAATPYRKLIDVRLWEAKTAKLLATIPFVKDIDDFARSVVFNADGSILAYIKASSIFVWDIKAILNNQIDKPRAVLHTGRVYLSSLKFSFDGKAAISQDTEGVTRLWDITTGKELPPPHAFPSGTVSWESSPDNTMAVLRDKNGKLHLWSMKGQRQVVEFNGSQPVFSPDSALLAFVQQGAVKVLDVMSGKEVLSLVATVDTGLTQLVFHPHGRILAFIPTASGGGVVSFWDIQTGQQLAFIDHALATSSLVFSPDGTLLAFGRFGDACGLADLHLWGIRP